MINHIYIAVKQELVERLGQQGYVIIEERENDRVFDSKFIVWSNNKDLIRFTWDGKENVFLIEVSNDLPISPLTMWTGLCVESFDPTSDPCVYVYNTAAKIVKTME